MSFHLRKILKGERGESMVKKSFLAAIIFVIPGFVYGDNEEGQEPICIDSSVAFDQGVASQESPLSARMKEKKEGAASREKRGEVKPKTAQDQEKDLFQWFQTYAEVVGLVQKKGFKTVDFAKFIQNSLKSAVANVDAHSAFFDQESYKAAQEVTSGEFSGIGVSVITKAPDDDALVIVDVIQGGPADKAGLKSGDKIVAVNQEKLRGLSGDEVVTKLKGKLGSEVMLKVIRDRKPMDFTVKRDIIQDQTSICYYFKDQGVYYLSLTLFTENAANQMAALLKKANEGTCNGIVLDLRRNPGGTLDSAIDMAGFFLPKKSLVVVTKDNSKKTVASYYTKTEPLLNSDVPIFILVNNLTASAAEILAGCLAYHSRKGVQIVDKQNSGKKKAHNLMVFVVGMPSFGKGSVQELIPIKNGCALKLTTMLYFLPENTSIQATGIYPDFTVKPKVVPVEEMKWMTEFYGKESALKNHISAKEVSEAFGIKLAKEAEQNEELLKNTTSELEDIVDFGDDERPGREVMSRGERELGKGKKCKEVEKSWEEKRREELSLDVQVQACVNMINLFTLAHKANARLVDTRQKAFEFLKRQYLSDEPVSIDKIG